MFHPILQAQTTEERPTKRRKSDHDPAFAQELAKENQSAGLGGSGRIKIVQSECLLKSVRDLRKEVVEGAHAGMFVAFLKWSSELMLDYRLMMEGLEAIVKNHIFVGIADLEGSLTMLQHQTKLYLVNHAAISYVSLSLHSASSLQCIS